MNCPAPVNPELLAAGLRAARLRADRITADLDGERLLGPLLAIVNPPLWEIGHVAWFHEYWCLRYRDGGEPAPSIIENADRLYDSAKVAHDSRWTLPLPTLQATRAYAAEVLELVLRRLEREAENRALQYFVRLATLHEDMHAEAFHYTRQTLGYADPFAQQYNAATAVQTASTSGDAEFAGGHFMLGAVNDGRFVFDNEKWAHEVRVAPFCMARTAVSNAEYRAFVESGGYLRREWWSNAGRVWLDKSGLSAPQYWSRQGNTWQQRRFDQSCPLIDDEPVVHVNWHEAQAYCRYAKRRLPTAAEWEFAAAMQDAGSAKRYYAWGDDAPDATRANLEGSTPLAVDALPDGDTARGCKQMIGNVWEWTADVFNPYPGFIADPYKEYSQPWFGTHMELRGGSFSTPRRLIRNTWRNFYTPDRNDIFA
ncbi:MAG: ergothioneine biosynthesis protein EgtB, partial [Betaproteobacteria bacterium]|nr:ergothioneine biosynthesis protein EgtB [Betaproteobacteria bacterium]